MHYKRYRFYDCKFVMLLQAFTASASTTASSRSPSTQMTLVAVSVQFVWRTANRPPSRNPHSSGILHDISNTEKGTVHKILVVYRVSVYRVSIPKSTLKNAYRCQPKTRKEFEATDSMALSHVSTNLHVQHFISQLNYLKTSACLMFTVALSGWLEIGETSSPSSCQNT